MTEIIKCPICGEKHTLIVCDLYQVSHNYKVKNDGTLCKNFTRDGEHPMEQTVLVCKNGCNVNDLDWDFKNDKLIIENKTRRELR